MPRSQGRRLFPVIGRLPLTLTLDKGGTDVHILNNGVSAFDGQIKTTLDTSIFDLHVKIKKGDTIDFAVGVGPDGSVSEAYHGRLRKARELFQRSVESAKRNEALERAAGYRADLGVVEAYFGYPQQATADAVAVARLDSNFQISAWGDVVDPVLPMALSGDTREAENLAAELSTRLPRDTAIQRFYLPTFGAAIALQRKQADKVLSLLQGLSSPEQSAVAEMHPSYLRGQAYLMLHNGGAAAVEFQEIIDHPGLIITRSFSAPALSALSRLGLARACALQGDTAKSRVAYQDSLTLWEDADPDIPS